MGTWEIKIRGTGAHHNGRPDDADALAKKLVGELQAAGSTVREAGFAQTYTGSGSGGVPLGEMPAAAGCEGYTDLLEPPA